MSGGNPYNRNHRIGLNMMPQEHTRPPLIAARTAPDAHAIVKRAAEIQGRSLSDFVVAAAQEAAHRTIEETQIIRLSVEDQRAFAPRPNLPWWRVRHNTGIVRIRTLGRRP